MSETVRPSIEMDRVTFWKLVAAVRAADDNRTIGNAIEDTIAELGLIQWQGEAGHAIAFSRMQRKVHNGEKLVEEPVRLRVSGLAATTVRLDFTKD